MATQRETDRRVEELERGHRRQADEIDQLRRELRALGVQVPSPGPGRTKLSPEARRAAQIRAAANARSKKKVGTGRGCVKSEETAARMLGQLTACSEAS